MIEPLQNDDDARACAAMMVVSDPWKTIGRSLDDCLRAVTHPDCEVYVAREDGAVRGFIIVMTHGALLGYIRIICVDPNARGRGLGSQLVAFAEERIFREWPNAFVFVSSFNTRARALYERLGYEVVAELRDYLIRGASEILMRKSIGPLITSHVYQPRPDRPGEA